MMSRCMFEKLEGLIRGLKDNSVVFGGCQIVLVGDFVQLPPVKNLRYDDPGEFCFTSIYFPKHRIFLKEVKRQEDAVFSSVIQKIALGAVDEETVNYINTLSRTLPPPVGNSETVRLFSINTLADMYNRDCLIKLPGEVFEFAAKDEGDERTLGSLTVQKTLWLKKNAKVMLLRNISDQLVNGLCGRVLDIREGEVDVLFPTVDKQEKLCTLKRMNFAVFNPSRNRNEAVRSQLPLKLAYAITIHKAQGMTLSRVEVDCRQIFFQPEQLTVAMGRVRSPDGLRVVNFQKEAVIPQSDLVYGFFRHRGLT